MIPVKINLKRAKDRSGSIVEPDFGAILQRLHVACLNGEVGLSEWLLYVLNKNGVAFNKPHIVNQMFKSGTYNCDSILPLLIPVVPPDISTIVLTKSSEVSNNPQIQRKINYYKAWCAIIENIFIKYCNPNILVRQITLINKLCGLCDTYAQILRDVAMRLGYIEILNYCL